MDRRIRFFLKKDATPIDIHAFEYVAQRMGNAPTITTTIYSFDYLDITTSSWCQFLSNDGALSDEKFFVRNEPSSEKSNTDARYKYSITFVSEREILDNVYFIDADNSTMVENTVVSKGLDFQFSGKLQDYVNKLNAAFSLSKLSGYSVEIDSSVATQDIAKVDKFFSVSRVTFTGALQEIYNQFDVPYYFVGKTIHVGYFDEGFDNTVVRYGSNDALIQVSKSTKGNKIVTRCSGLGSSENLPSYYPNLSQTGEHKITAYTGNIDALKIKNVDYDKLSSITNLHAQRIATFRAKSPIADDVNNVAIKYYDYNDPRTLTTEEGKTHTFDVLLTKFESSDVRYKEYYTDMSFVFYAEKGVSATGILSIAFAPIIPNATAGYGQEVEKVYITKNNVYYNNQNYADADKVAFDGASFSFVPKETGQYSISVKCRIVLKKPLGSESSDFSHTFSSCSTHFDYITNIHSTEYVLFDDSEKTFSFAESGITFVDGFKPKDFSTITISEPINWIQPQKNLMPSIYRASNGVERFYNAINGGYSHGGYKVEIDDNIFVNEFDENRFYEHIEDFEDIKPTIKGAVNEKMLRMDMFSAFAYDKNDNSDKDEEGHPKHSFFYGKLRKLDFNLFDQALDEGEMTISFTSGECGACNFAIKVDEKTKKNILQVESNGSAIKRDKDGKGLLKPSNPQDRQNDTSKYEVWVVLEKDESTYGELRPNSAYKPKSANEYGDEADTFVITNIRMPNSYILNAEKKLENEILLYMQENNLTGYDFSVKFSRIFLEENKKEFTASLNENSRLNLEYQGDTYNLYVNSFSYKVSSEDALPEIAVTISDSLQISKSGLSTLVSNVKSDVLAAVHNIDIFPTLSRYAIRKDKDDSTPYELSAGALNVTNNAQVGGNIEAKGDVDTSGSLSVGDSATIKRSLTVGDFSSVLGSISGGQISEEGDASFKSIKANSLEVMSFIYNQIEASSSYTAFDDTAIVSNIEVDENGVYTLTFDESALSVKNEDGFGVQSFKMYDILHGRVNNINNYDYSRAGECWLKVVKVPSSDNDLKDNQIEVTMYGDSDVPDNKNLAPTTNMTLMHRGNEVDTTRQGTFYISSKDGAIVQLLGVTSPKLFELMSEGNEENYSNYGVVIGKLPKDLFKYIQNSYAYIKEEDPIVYAKYLAVQNLLQIDYAGRPIRQEIYRGHWSAETAKNDPYQSSLTSYDTVTHNGSLWQCMMSDTKAEPKEGIADWLIKVAKGDDATASIYELVPSANIIYYRTAEKTLSINTLDVKVGQTTSYGYSLIDEQNVLTELGLKVSYAIDGVGERHNINISPVAAYLLEDGTAILATEDGYGLSLEGEDINVDAIKDNITLYLTDTTTGKDMATYIIPVVKDGEQGKEGARGTSYYMAGELTFGTAYAEKDYIVKDINGNITDKPVFFRIPNGSDKPNYYVLQRGITAKENTELNLSNPSMWKPFTKMENLYAEFLMADWAKFGGPNGAIFYGKYMFSQKGIDKWGNEATWGKDMFDESGNLSGKFIPNMMFNFETGEAMLGRLTETLRTIEDPVVYMDSYRNAVVTPTAGYTGGGATQGFSKPLVILPQVGENNAFASGTRISIFAQVSTSNRDRNDEEDNFPLAGVYKAASTFALVSADDIVGGYIDTSGSYKGNWIMADGYRSKFLLIGAGEMVNMRLSVSEGMNIWVVENDADVTNMPCMIYGQKELHDTVESVTASVNYNDYTGEDAWRTINSYGTSRDASWKLDNIVNNKNEYIPAVLATKSVRNSLNSTAFIGLKLPHIILSTNADGWLDNHHYRLYDRKLDIDFPTIT